MHIIYRIRTAVTAVLFITTAALYVPDLQAQYFGRNKVQYDNFDFKTFKTDHYDIYFYPAAEQATRDAARMAERWYSVHSATFLHTYDQKPLIFYANDADFQQTNVIEGQIGQGTGGVTEALMDRVIMPFTGIYAETDHVLGHELVHSFQYDIAQSPLGGGLGGLSRLPLWLVEGMAEYLSVGRYDPHTAMWMRDAVLRDEIPTIEELSTDPRFFPYRYGQALMAYVAGNFGGNRAVAELFKLGTTMGLDSAITAVTGFTPDSLSTLWERALKSYYQPLIEGKTAPENAGRRVLAGDIDAGDMNIAPVVSPDGRYVAFISERDLLDIAIFIADTRTGEVIERLTTRSGQPHFDAIRFINSAGTWSPDGRRFAYVTYVRGDNRIEILDVQSKRVDRSVAVQGVGAIQNPAWSPDGRYIAFSGADGGISDLFLYDIETREVRQLTNDRYADIHPEWAPDGRTLVWASDRGPGGSNFETLNYAPMRLAFMDVNTANIEVTVPFEGAKHINPQYSPDGRSVYFISDRDGFSNVYRLDTASGNVFQVTNVSTGISGITALAPALSVSDDTGLMMFSVYYDNNYSVFALEPEQTQGTPVNPAVQDAVLAGFLPPAVSAGTGEIASDDVVGTLGPPPRVDLGPPDEYNAKLRLAYVGPPSIGVGYDAQFGAGIAGGVSFFFSDILGNHLLGTTVQANGTFKDIGGQVVYINRENQLNWGAQLSHVPYLTGGTFSGFDEEVGLPYYEQVLRRIFFTGAEAFAQYPFSTTRRLEGTVQYNRIGSDLDATRLYISGGQVVGREEQDIEDNFDALHLAQGSGALVGDYSFFGFTSPIRGGRYRFEAGYTAGSFNYGTLLADYRRYFFLNPVTFAFSAYHFGRYGLSEEAQNQLYPLNIGYSTYNIRGVHGYGINSFDPEECAGEAANECAVLDRVIGDRIAVAAAEVRVPLLGTRDLGLITFPYLPTELVGFFDAGVSWTANEPPVFKWSTDDSEGNVPVFSTGAAARVNLLGYVILEAFFAYPFQRPEKGGYFGLTLSPGW